MAKILLVDDTPESSRFIIDRLRVQGGYEVEVATSGKEALAQVERDPPDLVLLDVVMPGMSGYDVCRELRRRDATAALPIVLLTALEPEEQRVKGLEAGANEFLNTPVHWPELIARVRSLLETKRLYDTVVAQRSELEDLNTTLERRVAAQVEQIEKLNRLRRFLSPQVAELVVSGGEEWLESHRTQVATLCCDLRGFTAFSMSAEPEDTIGLLREYHQTVGRLIAEYQGTIDHLAGDGLMLFLNDPVPCQDYTRRAVELAAAMRSEVGAMLARWREKGFSLGFGVGVDAGYATIGRVGFETRFDYAATGRPVIFAARLCDVATDGQILVSERVRGELGGADLEFVGPVEYKGFPRPEPTYNVLRIA